MQILGGIHKNQQHSKSDINNQRFKEWPTFDFRQLSMYLNSLQVHISNAGCEKYELGIQVAIAMKSIPCVFRQH